MFWAVLVFFCVVVYIMAQLLKPPAVKKKDFGRLLEFEETLRALAPARVEICQRCGGRGKFGELDCLSCHGYGHH